MIVRTRGTWHIITPGSRRPLGRMLVSHDATTKAEAKLYQSIYGEPPSSTWQVSVARWDRGEWRDDRGQIVEGVTAWMELPEPKEPIR